MIGEAMATEASYQIESLGPSLTSNSPILPKSGPNQKSRWPAVKKVLWNSNRNRGLSSSKFDLKVPNYCESHVPIHSTFSDEQSMAPLLAEVDSKEVALQRQLNTSTNATSAKVVFDMSVDEDETRDTFETSLPHPKRPPGDFHQYQEFVSMFLNVFLQSRFSKNTSGISPENDPSDIVQNLASRRSCPDVWLFRRVAINLDLVAAISPDDDNPGYADNGVAINQLARLIDVAVLQFLSTVNEHTEVYSILWALDYMKNLLSSLINSMNSLNSFGWYGAPHIRIRKGTNIGRRSVTYPMQPPVFNPPPPVVVVGTPPASPSVSPERVVSPPTTTEELRDPVTGQRSPVLSSSQTQSPPVSEQSEQAPH